MSSKRIPYKIVITGSYNKDREKVCLTRIEEVISHARGIFVNMGLHMCGKDGIADYNEVQIKVEYPK
jgi:hypothetical protein